MADLTTLRTFPWAPAAAELHRLDEEADRLGHPLLKATITALLYALQGRALQHLVPTVPPDSIWLLERQPALDLVVYATIYLAPGTAGNTPPGPWSALPPHPRTEQWIAELLGPPGRLEDVFPRLRPFFAGAVDTVLAGLSGLFRQPFPELLVLCNLPEELLLQRGTTKDRREFHEHPEALALIRRTYLELTAALPRWYPGTTVERLDCSGPLEHTLARFDQLLRALRAANRADTASSGSTQP